MQKAESIPLGRILKHLPERGAWFAPAYQGPGGLFAVRAWGLIKEGPPMFQVAKLTKKERASVDISEPFLTMEAANRFAQRLAEGGSHHVRIA